MVFWRRTRPVEHNGGDGSPDVSQLAVDLAEARDALTTTQAEMAQLRPIVAHLHHRLRETEDHDERFEQLAEAVAAIGDEVSLLSSIVAQQPDVARYDDVAAVRSHAAKLDAELRRLDVNIACRIDALRADLAEAIADGDHPADSVIDLTGLRPTETGWTPRLIG